MLVNGKAEVVLLDTDSYQAIMERIERADLIEALREGLAAADRGELKPAEQVFAELRSRYGVPG